MTDTVTLLLDATVQAAFPQADGGCVVTLRLSAPRETFALAAVPNPAA